MHHPTDRITHTTALLHQSWSTGWNEKYLPKEAHVSISGLFAIELRPLSDNKDLRFMIDTIGP